MRARTLRGLRLSALLAVLLLISACADASSAGPPRGPLTERDLQALLVQAGDLPAELTAEPLTSRAAWLASVPAAPQELARRLVAQSGERGGVTLFVYGAGADVPAAYGAIAGALESAAQRPPQFIGSIGERSGIVTTSPPGQPLVYDLSFFRCRAAAYIRLQTEQIDDVLNYARRLDRRLQQATCP